VYSVCSTQPVDGHFAGIGPIREKLNLISIYLGVPLGESTPDISVRKVWRY